ncbi:MAG: sugar phosphate isomerase/epimerase family protein [Bacteroidales bacterium]
MHNIMRITATVILAAVLGVSCSTGGEGTSSQAASDEASGLPDSNYGGVQIGTITYSFRDMEGGVEAVIQACADAGINSVELMGTGVEEYLGAPENPVRRRFMRPPPGGQRPELTEEQQAALAQYQEELQAWRHSDGIMDKYRELRQQFNEAGIEIHIYKWTAGNSPEELDYSFEVARTLGAVGITAEMNEENCTNLGAAAERAGMLAIFHNHFQFAEEGFDVDHFLALSPANRLNFDAGHYFGSTGKDPCAFIEKYHDKIVSIHMKDKTRPDNEVEANANQVWGQGQAPIHEILQLIQENGWPIYCDIELEYQVKPWSTSVREVNTCREYCRQILL